MTNKESKFKNEVLKNRILASHPEALLIDVDPTNYKSFPDLLVLNGRTWAALETKRNSKARRQANQGYYVDLLDYLSFSRFVSPENIEEVLYDLGKHFNRFR